MDLKLFYYGVKWGLGFGKAEPLNVIFKRNKQVQLWAGDKTEVRFGKGTDGFPVEAKRPNTPKHFLSDGRPVHVFVEGKPEAVDILAANKPTYEDVEQRNMMASMLYFNQALEALYAMPKKFNINWKLLIILGLIASIALMAWMAMGGMDFLAVFMSPDSYNQAGNALQAAASSQVSPV